jgi:Raf kinase inhibitor-like YbhB/YbcL family protein
MICHDPDAPVPHGFTHWTLYGIPADTTEIVGPDADATYRPGHNDFGAVGYGGPQPPEGHGTHHYYFWVYALGRAVEGTPSRLEFLEAYGDDILEQNRVVGTYER